MPQIFSFFFNKYYHIYQAFKGYCWLYIIHSKKFFCFRNILFSYAISDVNKHVLLMDYIHKKLNLQAQRKLDGD